MQRRVYLDKSRLHLMQNGGGIAVEFFTAHIRKFARCTFHHVGQYSVVYTFETRSKIECIFS
jgi:hypothetical protein